MTVSLAYRFRLVTCLTLCLLSLLAQQAVDAEDANNRYNVLLICIDDLRPELACYGSPAARSPHLDAFAREAFRFNRHYVQVPTCGASRYAMLTGRSPAHSRVTSNNAAFYQGGSALKRGQQAGAQTMPEMFRRSGYRTVCIGKISHTPDGRVFAYNGSGDGRRELPHAWDELATPLGPWKRPWGIFFAYADGLHREDGGGHKDLMQFQVERDEDLPDGLMAEAAVKQLRQLADGDQPFFLGVGFFKPHLPFVAPRGDWEAFADVEIPLPPPGKIDSPYWHRSGEFYKYNFPFPKQRPLAAESQRHARRAYLACVRYVDRQVGKVLAALKETGLEDDTIVVVWGDHGWHLGEQQVWGKHTPFERALRSVLMIRVPGASRVGRTTDALVETIDLYPTLVDLCQPSFQQTQHPLDGKSLAPLLRGESDSHREYAVSYWRDAASLRTDAYRLVARLKDGSAEHLELYDLSSDPDSMTNIAGKNPQFTERFVEQLLARIR
jgi:arylsulfatase A-like enzyme